MSRREKCVFGEEVSTKTHDVCFLRGKQAEKHKPEANRYVSERKLGVEARKQEKKHMACVFWRRSKQKNTWRVFFGEEASRKNHDVCF